MWKNEAITNDDCSILRRFRPVPMRFGQPGQVVRLSVVVAEFRVRAISHLLDQSPRDTVAFRAERHRSLFGAEIVN